MRIKKMLAILIVAMLCALPMASVSATQDIDMTGERTPEETRRLFDEFLEREFVSYISSDTLTLHSFVRYPENYGITDLQASWGNLEVAPTMEDIESDRALIREFKSFDANHLTPEQYRSHQVYEYDLRLYNMAMKMYFMYDPFMGSSGYHAMLPIVLSEYEFYGQQDVEDYFVLLGTLGQMMDSLMEYEQMRAEMGLFMPDSALDEVIQGCEDFLSKRGDNVLIESFDDRVDAMEGLTAAQRAAYKAQNSALFDEVVVATYEDIIMAGMEALRGSGTNENGLAHYEMGQEYYTYRLLSMGVSKTPEELIATCETLMDEYYLEMQLLLMENMYVFDILYDNLTDEMTAEEIMEYLKEKSRADFPAIPDEVAYTLNTIDDSLKDLVAPAFYFTPKLDLYTQNAIYYNADYFELDRDYIFFTLAHEGYPGHLLQQVGMMASSLSNYRKVNGYIAYTEGWANYVQYYAYRYVQGDPILAEVMRLNEELSYLLILRIDAGVNYEGWTKQEMIDYIDSGTPFTGMLDQDGYDYYFDYVVTNPMQIVPYIAGMTEIRELAAYYQEQLGAGYSDMLFHETLLGCGEAPFVLIREWMDEELLGTAQAAA